MNDAERQRVWAAIRTLEDLLNADGVDASKRPAPVATTAPAKRSTGPAADSKSIDLADPKNDPEVQQGTWKRWSGPSYKGRRFSQCPSDFLVALASLLDFFAEKNARIDATKARQDSASSVLAYAWAEHNDGMTDGEIADAHAKSLRDQQAADSPEPETPQNDFGGDDDSSADIPF